MAQPLSVSDVARRLKANPRDVSDIFYRREIQDDLCPIVAGRRLIPEQYVPLIEQALRQRGLLPSSSCELGVQAASLQKP